jgi:hypothetical protein
MTGIGLLEQITGDKLVTLVNATSVKASELKSTLSK